MVPVAESGTVPFDDVPGVSIRFAFGHTDAMMCPQVEVNGRTLVFMADLLPSPAHIPLPYVMGYDMFPLKTLEEKRAFLEEAAAGNYLLLYQHDPVIEAGELVITEKGIRSGKTGSLSAFI
jgi:glyoxylase-like metal-dependent hydrolase (beta-lactamase superfamily II)